MDPWVPDDAREHNQRQRARRIAQQRDLLSVCDKRSAGSRHGEGNGEITTLQAGHHGNRECGNSGGREGARGIVPGVAIGGFRATIENLGKNRKACCQKSANERVTYCGTEAGDAQIR